MKQFRCKKCHRLLARITNIGEIESKELERLNEDDEIVIGILRENNKKITIKCPKCKVINTL